MPKELEALGGQLRKNPATHSQRSGGCHIRFEEAVQLLVRLGFSMRVRGDHHILSRTDIPDILNVQPKGSMAKPYQIKQIRNLILKYRLRVTDDE